MIPFSNRTIRLSGPRASGTERWPVRTTPDQESSNCDDLLLRADLNGLRPLTPKAAELAS